MKMAYLGHCACTNNFCWLRGLLKRFFTGKIVYFFCCFALKTIVSSKNASLSIVFPFRFGYNETEGIYVLLLCCALSAAAPSRAWCESVFFKQHAEKWRLTKWNLS